MAMKLKSTGEESQLARRAVQLVKDLGVEGNEGDQQELRQKRVAAETALTEMPPSQALQAAIVSLEQLLVAGVHPQIVGSATPDGESAGNSVIVTGKRAHHIKGRLREILWVAKDALGCFKDTGDQLGAGLALKALARVHLSRSYEPDAPMAALRCAKESITTFHGIGNALHEAEALQLCSDAHLTKARLSPYDRVVQEESERAAQTARQAASLFREAGDRKGEGKALHSLAAVVLSSDDEDQQLEAERYVQDALELFKEIKNKELECTAMMTAISARLATSGPEAAVQCAKDAAADWKAEGARPEHEGMAMHAAAEIHLSLGELDKSTDLCKEAMRMFERASSKRGTAGALQTLLQVAIARGNTDQALKVAEQVAGICQEINDKRGEGSALAFAAEMILTKLCSEVAEDTEAASAKKDPPLGLTTEEVGRRAEDGLDFANRAFLCFEEIGDEPGMGVVQNIIQATFQKGVDVYCAATAPDRIYTTLEVDSHKEKESKLEWSIDFPNAKRLIIKA